MIEEAVIIPAILNRLIPEFGSNKIWIEDETMRAKPLFIGLEQAAGIVGKSLVAVAITDKHQSDWGTGKDAVDHPFFQIDGRAKFDLAGDDRPYQPLNSTQGTIGHKERFAAIDESIVWHFKFSADHARQRLSQ